MLFNYRYISHDVERLQAWLRHLVQEVWCRHGGAFSLDLLHEELRLVILDVFNTEEQIPRGNTGDLLFGPIKRIDAIFQRELTAPLRNQFRDWFDYNNDISALCSGNPVVSPISYDDIKAINIELATELKAFCGNLFARVIEWSAVTSRAAKIDDHYDAFVTENDEGKCPYCGYGDIKGQHHSRREAYDHFLPKGTYPFNSVNFRNLAPMCNECNSSYKLQKDPIRHIDPLHKVGTATRRKAFYSYAAAPSGISIDVAIATTDITLMSDHDITLTITSPGRDEEVEAWKDVFGIEERYKAKFCAKNDGKAWLQQIVEECANTQHGLTKDDLLNMVFRSAERSPYDSANFLKKPFLLACQNAGMV